MAWLSYQEVQVVGVELHDRKLPSQGLFHHLWMWNQWIFWKETTGQFPANTAPLWWAVLSAAVWQALMREQKAPLSDFIDLQNIMRQSPQTCSKYIYGNLIWLFEKEHSWFTTKQTDCVTPPDHIHGTQDLEESLSSVCRFWC